MSKFPNAWHQAAIFGTTGLVLLAAANFADRGVVGMPEDPRVIPAPAKTALVTAALASSETGSTTEKFGLGRPATNDEIAAWDLDILPDGTGLPDGEGSVLDGEEIFADACASCHGDFAEGVDNWPKLAGGMDTLADEDPLKTVGSYWPYLSTTYDYVRRSMPFGGAQTLSDDEVYAIVAYILYSNDLVDEDFVLSKANFLEVELPNAGGFIVDDRTTAEAHFTAEPCMENCKDGVEITMRAAVLDVTPEEENDGGDAEAAGGDSGTEMAAADPEITPTVAEPAATKAPSTDAGAGPDPALVASGEKVFKKCKACHQVGDDAQNKVGPILTGIVGAPAGAVGGFKYSKPLVSAAEDGLIWNHDALAAFLTKPKAFLKGTKMSFAGLKKPDDVAAVIAYIEANSQ